MRKIIFEYRAFEDFNGWPEKDKKIHRKIVRLIEEISFGHGKTRTTQTRTCRILVTTDFDSEHRLVYKVTDDAIIIIGCKNHY